MRGGVSELIFRRSFPWCLLLCLVMTGGCGSRKKPGLPPAFQGYDPPDIYTEPITKLDSEGERSWVLNLNELAVEAMRHNDHELAKRALDESILYINDVFGSTPEANRARNLFFNEDVKLYKGDPFERSMTFFYRGVLYMQNGEWDNARACFRSAAFQDAFAEEQQNRDDWVLFDYLIGVCELQLNRDPYAKMAFRDANRKYDQFKDRFYDLERRRSLVKADHLPVFTRENNLLVLVQTGEGPRKVRNGHRNQFQSIKKGAKSTRTARVQVADKQSTTSLLVDSVYFQAATRGGRPIDQLQGRKVVFKDATDVTGSVATNVGAGLAIFSSSSSTRELGLIIAAAGIATQIVSELTATKADIRTWLSLPDAICLRTEAMPAGHYPLTVSIPGQRQLKEKITLPPPGKGVCVVLTFPGKEPTALLPPGD